MMMTAPSPSRDQLDYPAEHSDSCLGHSTPGRVGSAQSHTALIPERTTDMAFEDEFPLLTPIGLYAAHIRGDGNCLFNALSDQLYGSQDQHAAIRSQVIDHMRAHADYYKMFLEVYPGGGTRRNPKRKNAGSANMQPGPSAADIDRVFEEHVVRMARGGTWGDNLEIQAFASTFDTNVQIYQRELSYVIQAPNGQATNTARIAYHSWEHYSSIRNLDGPHSGLPNATPKPLDFNTQTRLEQDIKASTYPVADWQINSLSQAFPTADRVALRRALEDTKGDIDSAYERLMAAEDPRSISSQQSSSVEREPDSDDESVIGPSKRRDRRMSRGTKAQQSARAKSIAFGYEKHKDSLESLVNVHPTSFTLSQPKASSSSSSDADDDLWDLDPPPLHDGDTSSGSEYTPPPEMEPPKLKIKLSMPKRDDSKESTPNASKPTGVQKKHVSSRQKKDIKKQAQKQASKERKQASITTKMGAFKQPGFEQSNHPTNATTAMKTLWI